MRFLNLKAQLNATLTLLTTTGAIAVYLWDQYRSGQETPNPLPHFGFAYYPLKLAGNQFIAVYNFNIILLHD